MLNFFLTLTLGMLGLFLLLEVYNRTVGRWFANRSMYKHCKMIEDMENNMLNPDIMIDGPVTKQSLDPDLKVVDYSEDK
jgi:hypothetical protein